MATFLIVTGRIWKLDNADSDALVHALSQLEGKLAPAADALTDDLTRHQHNAYVDINDDASLAALYAALGAVDPARNPSDTVTQLRLAIGQRTDSEQGIE
jgi:hypothetical protein